MGLLTARLVLSIVQSLVMAGLSLLVAILLLRGLGKKRSPLVRVFGTVLLASIGYMVLDFCNYTFLMSWLMATNPSLAALVFIFASPLTFFFVYIIAAIILLDLGPGRIIIAAIIHSILSYPFFWISLGLLPFLSLCHAMRVSGPALFLIGIFPCAPFRHRACVL